MSSPAKLFLAIFAILLITVLHRLLFSDDQSAPPNNSTVTQESQTPGSDQGDSTPTKIKAWPFHTGDYEMPLADDQLARNFVLIFDGSGSMNEVECSEGRVKIDVAKEAVLEWLQSIPAGANLGLVAFHGGHSELVTEEISPGNRDRIESRIDQILSGGSTPLASSFAAAYKLMEKQAQSQLGYGEYTIVVVTDGIADDPKILAHNVDYILKRSPVEIYTIGFCIGKDHTLNQPRRITYKTANNPAELREGLVQVLAESENFDLDEF